MMTAMTRLFKNSPHRPTRRFAPLEILEQRTLLSTVINNLGALSPHAESKVPPFTGTASPGDPTAPGPVLTTLTPTLQWTLSTVPTDVTGIQINLFDRTRSNSKSYKVSPTATSFTLPAGALTNGDAYVWNLRFVEGTRTGEPGTYLYFQAPPVPPLPTPVITSPGDATSPGPILTTNKPTFQWTPVTGVSGMTGYQLTLYNITTAKTATYKISSTATTFTLPGDGLITGDAYVWNLRVLAGTRTGPVSNYLYFQAPPAPALPAPVITSPGNATSPGPVLTTSTPNFEWTPVTGVTGMTGYQLNLYDSTKSVNTTYQISSTVNHFTLPAGVLTAGDAYVWNLRVVAGNRSGPPSAYFYFQAPPAATPTIPAPVITSPGTSATPGPILTTTTPTFQWTAITGVAGMTGYQLNLYDSTTAKLTTYQISATATSFTLPTGVLTLGDHYIWNLRLVLGATTGPESTAFYFQAPPVPTTTIPAPVISSPGSTPAPGSTITTFTPTFQWTPITGVAGMTGYQLNLYDATTAKLTTYQISADASSFTLPAGILTPGNDYVWNLRLVLGTKTGPESNYLDFQAPAAAV